LVVFFWGAAEESNFSPQVIVTTVGEHETKSIGVKRNHRIYVLAKEAEMCQLCVRWSIHGLLSLGFIKL
jgi:hypothetical protein